jgi:hypothetical protein
MSKEWMTLVTEEILALRKRVEELEKQNTMLEDIFLTVVEQK